MTSVLKPEITSIVNGLLTTTVRSVAQVAAVYNQLLVFRASSVNGPFSQLVAISLSGAETYAYLDTETGPGFYYKVQYYNSGTMASSPFSELAQETGVFSEYTVPVSTATYPPEIAPDEQSREIIESIRVTVGDMGSVERDTYDSSDPQAAAYCSAHVSSDGYTWEFFEPRGWPRTVTLNGEAKTSLADPQVVGYRFLTFTGTTITGSLDVFYNHFRFTDREILLAYDRSENLLVTCGLTGTQITTEMRIMQAAILLLDGEIRSTLAEGAVRIRDGDTEFDNTRALQQTRDDLTDLRRKLQDLIDCAIINASYYLEGVRVD